MNRPAESVSQTLIQLGLALVAEHDLDRLVQRVIDSATHLSQAQYGALFYNRHENRAGGRYDLYALSGASIEAFSHLPPVGRTALLAPTFEDKRVVRSGDITRDARYGLNAQGGMPDGHLPVRSYLAVPVLGRSGDVLGGVLLGHAECDQFDEHTEQLIRSLASQAGVAIDNARLLGRMHAAMESLREADVRKDEFLAILAHELRNPLAPLTNALHMLERDALPQALHAQALGMAQRQARQLSRLVDDLLDVSRITTGKIALRTEPLVMQRMVEQAIEAIRPQALASGLTIEQHLPAQALCVQADSTRMAQVLGNLLTNACRYNHHGGTVRVMLSSAAGHVQLRIEDNGIGIEKNKLSRLFELFTQVDDSANHVHGGLGIGLALVKRLVQMHGGHVQAQSDGPGHGAQFMVSLPQVACAQAASD